MTRRSSPWSRRARDEDYMADPATAPADSVSPPSEPSKAQSQSRRAQVRSAQIRHRQRKANYQKQLELDVSQYRDLIAQTDAEASALRRENEAIRSRLAEAGIDASQWIRQQQQQYYQQHHQPTTEDQAHSGLQSMHIGSYGSSSHGNESQSPPIPPAPSSTTPELFSNIDVNDLTVTLAMDDAMGTPAFNISSSSSGGGASLYSSGSPPQSDDDGWYLTPAQEEAAINFVLALEHVCWNHFAVGDFPHHHQDQDHPIEADEDEGHALMATTFCMAHAPDSLYDARRTLQAATTQQQQSGAPSSTSASPPPSFQWQSAGINLAALRGLASSLNPGDSELTPVQAWFELAERYPPVTLLEGGILERLKREFRGVVRCVAFGAAIEREAFESVVSRVIAEFTPSW